MSTKTDNLQMNKWFENDPVNFEEVNDNFLKLDDCTQCFERGAITSNYSGGLNGVGTWIYRKYTGWNMKKSDDGVSIIKTVEACVVVDASSLNISTPDSAMSTLFHSSEVQIDLPFEIASLSYINIRLTGNVYGGIIDNTKYESNLSMLGKKLKIQLWSMKKEESSIPKKIMINLKGVLN